MRRSTLAAALVASVTPAALAQIDSPAVTRTYTVFAGDKRVNATTAPTITYFGGMKQYDAWSRLGTVFGGSKQLDAWDRNFTVERGACDDPLLAPTITMQPSSTLVCLNVPGGEFQVAAEGIGRITYLWQIETNPGTWEPLSAFPLNLPCGGVARVSQSEASTTINIVPCENVITFNIRCVVGNACGDTISDAVTMTVCQADFNCDGQLDFFDYLDFASAFSAEEPTADYNGDAQIDFFDYLDFAQDVAFGC
ncbi:MAG: hypothetical protein SFZ23_08565 [Planctomycetota bacterium]|nr:hypothetical protein [Planctomycetota bacterium]